MKKIAILGSTGSIGTQTLDVVRANGDIEVLGISAGRNVKMLEEQAREFHPQLIAVWDENAAKDLAYRLADMDVKIVSGMEGLLELARMPQTDILVTAVVGMIGIRPTMEGIKAGKDIALANKETLVTAGHLIIPMAKEHGVQILPVDSEHSAIFQSLQGNQDNEIRRILLTASGGPFRGYSLEQLEQVSMEQALNHPNWSMGSKITIDSATMMNKGLEVIEARWLFDVPLEKIQVVVHPQSILHSAVEYMDSSIIGQMGNPDMRIPIAYAFSYPERMDLSDVTQPLDLFSLKEGMSFYPADRSVFKTIDLAYEACREGGSCPVVLNGANEVLVDLFLHGKIRFIDIQNFLIQMMEAHQTKRNLDLETILEEDMRGREDVRKLVEKTI